MDSEDREQSSSHRTGGNHSDMKTKMYLKFGAMILTGMVVMYAVMFVSSWEWGHIRLSESRIFMALTMGGSMGLVMFAWMRDMYQNRMANLIVIAMSVLLLGVGVVLDRSQMTVSDTDFMQSMIPHHSMAITRAERFTTVDVRVCELAVEISEAQRREIREMDWLLDDIRQNGPAATPGDAEARPVPDFNMTAERQCPPN